MKIKNKKEYIALEAKKFFEKYGYSKTTMDEIAKSARVAKATIYNYFKTKEELFIEVIKYEVDKSIKITLEYLSSFESPIERLKAYVHKRIEMKSNFLKVYNITLDDIKNIDVSPVLIDYMKEITDIALNHVKEIFSYGADKGFFDKEKIKNMPIIFLGQISGLEYLSIFQIPTIEVEDYMNNFIDIILNGILKKGN